MTRTTNAAASRFPPRVRLLAALAAALLVLQVLVLGKPPGADPVIALAGDKLVHLAAFGALAFLLWTASDGRAPAGVFAAVLAVGLADEALQLLTPGRVADLRDLAADAMGAGAVLLTLSFHAPPLQAASGPTPFTPGG